MAALSAATFLNGAPVWGQSPATVESSDDAAPETLLEGEYLVGAGFCRTCHTASGGEPFAGGVAFRTDFGTIYSTNITSHPESGIGSWTFDEFIKAMRHGISDDGRRLYPVFPYTSFAKMTDEDLRSVFEYLRGVAPSDARGPENELSFPFGQRWLLGIWNALFFNEERFEPNPEESDEWNRGSYLVEAVSHCGACHTPRNFLGGSKSELALSGGTYLDLVEPGKFRPWSATNLTPSEDGLGYWSVDDLVRYLATGHSARAGTFGPMNKVIGFGTSKFRDSDVEAIATYLMSLPKVARASKYEMDEADRARAEVTYGIHCGTCHLPTGLGDPTLGPPLVGSSIVQAADPASLINSIIYGAIPSPSGHWEPMESFGDKLSDREIASISTFMRSSWGNFGGPVTAEQVAKQR